MPSSQGARLPSFAGDRWDQQQQQQTTLLPMSQPPAERTWSGRKYLLEGVYRDPDELAAKRSAAKRSGASVRTVRYPAAEGDGSSLALFTHLPQEGERKVYQDGGPGLRPDRDRRRQVFSVSANRGEEAEIRRRAQKAELDAATYLRNAGLGASFTIVPQVNREQWIELARTTSNLNQIARALNEGRLGVDAKEVLVEVRKELRAVRSGLLGKAGTR